MKYNKKIKNNNYILLFSYYKFCAMYLRRCFVLIYVNITNLNVVIFSVFYFNNVPIKLKSYNPID